jgi:uncharacterized repeat protein (TIGR01451 family)
MELFWKSGDKSGAPVKSKADIFVTERLITPIHQTVCAEREYKASGPRVATVYNWVIKNGEIISREKETITYKAGKSGILELSLSIPGDSCSSNLTDSFTAQIVTDCTDLSITKNDDVSNVTAGGTTTYKVVVTNNGTLPADGAVFTDPAVAGLSVTGVSCGNASGGAACPTSLTVAAMQGSGIVIPSLPNGGRLGFSVTANVTATSGSVTNTATITPPAGTADSNISNNTASDTNTVTTAQLTDLSITKTVNNATPNLGQNVTFTITVSNAGPSNATNVVVKDLLPAGLAFVSATPSQGGYVSGTGIWTVGSINNGASANIQITATVTTSGAKINYAQVQASDQPDPDSTPGDDSTTQDDDDQVSVTPAPAPVTDLSITKAVRAATFATIPPAATGAVVPGTPLTYRITVTNTGPRDLSNIVVTDILPEIAHTPTGVPRVTGAKFISATPVTSSGVTFTCKPLTNVNPNNNPNGNGGKLECTAPLMTAAAPNNTGAIDVMVFVDPGTTSGLLNKLDATATVNNLNQPITASFTLTTPVGPQSDIVLTKSHAPDSVKAGETLTYTITATNNGPSAAAMPRIIDTLPAFQASDEPDLSGAPGWRCSPGTASLIICDGPPLEPNKNQDGSPNPAGTITIRFRIRQDRATPQPLPAGYQNCVVFQSASFDPAPNGGDDFSAPDNAPDGDGRFDNARDCDAVKVIFSADLSITTSGPMFVKAGSEINYALRVENKGPSDAVNVMVTNMLPAQTSFVSASSSDAGFTCASAANKVTCNKTTLAASAAATITIRVKVAENAACGTLGANSASASGATEDPISDNNTADLASAVVAPPHLTKSFSAARIRLNDAATLSFTIQNPSCNIAELTGVSFTDPLPDGLVVASSGPLTACGGMISAAAGSNEIKLEGATIPVNGSCSFSLQVRGATAGNKTNQTRAITSTLVQGLAGNEAKAEIEVVSPPMLSKAFDAALINEGETTRLNFKIINPAGNTVSLTGVSFTDPMPAGLVVATPNGLTGSCFDGTITALAESGAIKLENATIPANGSCTFSVMVRGVMSDNGPNRTEPISSTAVTDLIGNRAEAPIIVNAKPEITPARLMRQAGSLKANATIATVRDIEDSPDKLTVKIKGSSDTVNNVTISNLAVSAAGTVTADITSECGATDATFILTVNDTRGASSDANLLFTVNRNTPPALSYPSLQTVVAGGSLVVKPTSGPSDNGRFIVLGSAPDNFIGTIAVDPATGEISIKDAGKAGRYTIPIRAVDNCNATTDVSFVLEVTCPAIVMTVNSEAICLGGVATLTATPRGGTGPYEFSWTGPTGFNATTQSIRVSVAGEYKVTVTDKYGCSVSGVGTLTVNPLTEIRAHPKSLIATAGRSAEFSVVAVGANLRYQWRKRGESAILSTDSSLKIPSVTPNHAGRYEVEVSGTCGPTITSNLATLLVAPASIDFGMRTPGHVRNPNPAAMETLLTNNSGARVMLNLDSIQRNLANALDRRPFFVKRSSDNTQVNPRPNEEILLDPGESLQVFFDPLIPARASCPSGFDAAPAMPDQINSQLKFTYNGTTVAVALQASLPKQARLIDPCTPQNLEPLVKLECAGDIFTVECSVYDANRNIEGIKYQFLDKDDKPIENEIPVDVTSVIGSVTVGQSFTIMQRFSGAIDHPEVAKVRVTVCDPDIDRDCMRNPSAPPPSPLPPHIAVSGQVVCPTSLTDPILPPRVEDAIFELPVLRLAPLDLRSGEKSPGTDGESKKIRRQQ